METKNESVPLQITKELLKPWSPCHVGYKWFLSKFPQGAEYTEVQKALRVDNRFDDARWLTNNVWQNLILESPVLTSEITKDHMDEALEIIEQTTSLKVSDAISEDSGNDAQIGSSGNDARIGSSGNDARIGSSGYTAQIGSSGNDARIGSSGYAAQIGSSGNAARIGSSGNDAQIGSSGYTAQIGSSGNDAQIGSSGNAAQINATGKNAVIACAGDNSKARAGISGVMALSWFDDATQRIRIAVGYVGENIKADTWYVVKKGEFVEVAP